MDIRSNYNYINGQIKTNKGEQKMNIFKIVLLLLVIIVLWVLNKKGEKKE